MLMGPSGFEWSKTFNRMALGAGQVANWLGVDGSLTPDIGNVSHLWQAEAVTVQDQGTETAQNLTSLAGVVSTTDPDFGNGLRNVLEFTTRNQWTAASGANPIPDPMDGTKSLLAGLVFRPDSLSGGDTLRNIFGHWQVSPTRGWHVSFFTSNLFPTSRLWWSDGSDDAINAPDVLVNGDPIVLLLNIDMSALLLKIISPFGIATIPITDVGDFDVASKSFLIGDNGISGWDGWLGFWAQAFTFEYLASLDGEIGLGNLERFLQFTDGILGNNFPTSGLVGHWDADLGVTLDATEVSVWADQSGNGNDWLRNVNGPSVASAVLNGHDAINFDGVNDLLSQAAFLSGSNDGEMMLLMRRTTTANRGSWSFGTGSNSHWMFSNSIYEDFASTLRITGVSHGGVFDLNEWGVYSVAKANAGNLKIWTNGEIRTDSVRTTGWNTTFYLGSGSSIGTTGGSLSFEGQIIEMAIWDRELSDVERWNAATWLKGKHGI